ncbi:MAG: alpha-galactosidase [Bryobacterales bacterium]|nr:alpha-galactosidase [Bryobacterales bacterium]
MLLSWVAGAAAPAAEILVADGRAVLKSESLERVIRFDDGNVRTVSFTMNGHELLAAAGAEFSFVAAREASNRPPRQLSPDDIKPTTLTNKMFSGEGIDVSRYDDTLPGAPKWVDERAVEASGWRAIAGPPIPAVTKPGQGVTRLTLRTPFEKNTVLEGVSVELFYELYDGYPVVRKWAVVRNHGSRWLRVDRMVIDDIQLVPLTRKSLAAAMFGVQPSVVAFDGSGGRFGLIAASEIPSALRTISDQGSMGYARGLFEWVIGPNEEFTSEPVFYYGYDGPVTTTAGPASTPLDRTLEGRYMDFLKERIGIAAETAPMHGPQWMTWAYFYDKIDDKLVRQLAAIAGRAGFTEMLLDDGWQKGRLGTQVDTAKFPDFAATAEFVRAQGLKLGLWVSCYRDTDSPDLRDMPDGRALPVMLRSPTLPGLAMSFASPWRDYYVKDLAALARRYGVSYIKQDFSAILLGDLAEGHESRTLRESLLRGLRGLLAAQDGLRREAPGVVNEITHEIYWGTPGVPADLAALKHTARFHIPPNQAVGADIPLWSRGRADTSPEEHAAALRRGCWLARQRFYSHRAMPLYALEFYAAATTNHKGSLTPEIQDRQVASWLMGAPVCFSGDLRTLTEENVTHYRKRLEAVRRLQESYGIYKYFQFSGAPEPTDVDWHWWGKLNPQGHGAVVVVRGSGGQARRVVDVPWVRRHQSYRVTGLFRGKPYGVMSGAALQDTGITVELPIYGQEIFEFAPASR